MTEREIARIRMKNEYEMMKNMKGDVLQFTTNNTTAPSVYKLTINLRSVVGVTSDGKPIYRDKHEAVMTLPDDFPKSPPVIKMEAGKQPFHPNWYTSGKWCYGHWNTTEPLWSYVRRMLETVNFGEAYTNVGSPANRAALPFWSQNKNLFPTDKKSLPTGDKPKEVGKISIVTKRKI